ncbi:MAG: SusD/RagB family nutrient-binding outer membrane lipoprotein, partial [Bacteroidia bacterium]|nr:SusD/RagB family nutrient-binding outer membrane lipoprotein [Bacteroidia bacterium]
DIGSWKKFANSLKLRLFLRMSGKDATFANTEMSKVVNTPATYPIYTGNSDHAASIYLGSAPNNNPINENRKTRDDHRVSNTLIDYLYNPFISPDYRVTVFANLSEGTGDWVGLPNGMLSSDAAAYNGNGLANTSKIGDYFSEASAPGMLMSYAELQFILAEAAFKGYISGDAASYYQAGITASWEQIPLDHPAPADPNMTLWEWALQPWAATFETWGWNPASDTSIYEYAFLDFQAWGGTWELNPGTEMEQIATQKWVAMFDQGIQAWFEWRRTGYPVLTPAVAGANGGLIPVRSYYPSDEYSRNPTNVANAVAEQGTDDLNTRVWWDVN